MSRCRQSWFLLNAVKESLGLSPGVRWFAGCLYSWACKSIASVSAFMPQGTLPVYLCIHTSPLSNKDISHTGLGPTLMTTF